MVVLVKVIDLGLYHADPALCPTELLETFSHNCSSSPRRKSYFPGWKSETLNGPLQDVKMHIHIGFCHNCNKAYYQ